MGGGAHINHSCLTRVFSILLFLFSDNKPVRDGPSPYLIVLDSAVSISGRNGLLGSHLRSPECDNETGDRWGSLFNVAILTSPESTLLLRTGAKSEPFLSMTLIVAGHYNGDSSVFRLSLGQGSFCMPFRTNYLLNHEYSTTACFKVSAGTFVRSNTRKNPTPGIK